MLEDGQNAAQEATGEQLVLNQANVRFVIIHHEILSEYPHWGNSFFILC